MTDTIDPNVLSRWLAAASRCDNHALLAMLDDPALKGMLVNASNERGLTALSCAVAPYGGCLSTVELLIAAGADVNARNAQAQNLVSYCYGGVTSGLENGLAGEIERCLRRAGFERRASDTPDREPDLQLIQARCAKLDRTLVEAAELALGEKALRVWEHAIAQQPIRFYDPVANAHFEVDGDLPTRAFAATRNAAEPQTIANASRT